MIKLGKYTGKLHFGRYAVNDRIAISFKQLNDYPICHLTVNLPDESLEENEVFLNSNIFGISVEEIIKVLKEEGIIISESGWQKKEEMFLDNGFNVQSGYVNYPKVKINLSLIK